MRYSELDTIFTLTTNEIIYFLFCLEKNIFSSAQKFIPLDVAVNIDWAWTLNAIKSERFKSIAEWILFMF